MRIAFDVLGTLKGYKGPALAEAFKKLQAMGHECVIWSSEYSFTLEIKKHYGLECDTMRKESKSENNYEEQHYFDVAVEDDRNQTYLAAHKFVFVDELRSNPDLMVEFILNKANESKEVSDE
jgi:hydroxymethylpyrimidine pyrophosphatase-like HAD family hydrolase